MRYIYGWAFAFLFFAFSETLLAQGPPITGDKPIMLGQSNLVVKTLTEIRETESGRFIKMPLMGHYLLTSNFLVGVHLPFVTTNGIYEQKTTNLGDVELLAKYQFYQKDQTGKTLRMIVKTLQTLPTGQKRNLPGISTGLYQNYIGTLLGYESIRYGFSSEIGYNLVPNGDLDELRLKLGFGLPLLKPTYPVNQINLFFEYQSSWFTEKDHYLLLYAQGIQYAKGRFTLESAIQFPLIDTGPDFEHRKYSLFLGTRYVF